MAAGTTRWGILGTGAIARQFAEGLRHTLGAELVAVGSRSAQSAAEFGQAHNVPVCHASYQELAADSDVDVVYVATPHPMHHDNCLMLIEQGRAVLCEKPFTLNAVQARQVIEAARERGCFVMEAMWTRFLPAIVKAREWVEAGLIGEVRMVQADFGFRAPLDPASRLFNAKLGGGSLLDVGIYPLSLASMLFGPHPQEIHASAHLGETGIDEQAVVILKYDEGQLAVCSSALRTNTPMEAVIMGTDGSIRLHAPFFRCTGLTLKRGDSKEYVSLPLRGNGYNYQAEEVGRCLHGGLLESPVMPLDESLALMQLMDGVRAQWQMTYPDETS